MNIKRGTFLEKILILLVLLLTISCGEVPDTQPLEGVCEVTDFYQPTGPRYDKIDILFVTDTSGSLDEERERVADGIQSYLNELADAGVWDFQIAVMLAHGASQWSGNLYHYGTNPAILTSQADIDSYFSQNIRNVPSDTTDGGEVSLYSFYNAVSNNADAIKAEGFFRDDAILNVIFISDENDICSTFPAGYEPVPDGQADTIYGEPAARETYCGGVTSTSVINAAAEMHGDVPVVFGAIVYTQKTENEDGTYTYYQGSGENEYGFGYMDLIEESNGIAIDLAWTDYEGGLAEVAERAIADIELINSLILDPDFIIDPNSVEVTINGEHSTAYSFIPQTNTVHLSDPGAAGSYIQVTYCEESDTVAPVISSVDSYSITSNSAFIQWVTDEAATSMVEYGTSTSFGSATTETTVLTSNHNVQLTALEPFRIYYFRAVSSDNAGNITYSQTFVFRTSR